MSFSALPIEIWRTILMNYVGNNADLGNFDSAVTNWNLRRSFYLPNMTSVAIIQAFYHPLHQRNDFALVPTPKIVKYLYCTLPSPKVLVQTISKKYIVNDKDYLKLKRFIDSLLSEVECVWVRSEVIATADILLEVKKLQYVRNLRIESIHPKVNILILEELMKRSRLVGFQCSLFHKSSFRSLLSMQQVVDLDLSNSLAIADIELIAVVTRSMGALRRLGVSNCKNISKDSLAFALTYTDQLSDLRIDSSQFSPNLTRLKRWSSIVNLQVDLCCDTLRSVSQLIRLQELVCRLSPHLHTLAVDNALIDHANFLMQILEQFPNLHYLSLPNLQCKDATKTTFPGGRSKYLQLEELCLPSVSECLQCMVFEMLNATPNLKILDISSSKITFGEDFELIARLCPRLRSLHLRECDEMSDASVPKILSLWPKLDCLDLADNFQLSDPAFLSLFHSYCVGLRSTPSNSIVQMLCRDRGLGIVLAGIVELRSWLAWLSVGAGLPQISRSGEQMGVALYRSQNGKRLLIKGVEVAQKDNQLLFLLSMGCVLYLSYHLNKV